MSSVGSVLNYINDQVYGDGVERLRLMLYPVLDWKELEKCIAPSDMFQKLEAVQETREEALEIFVFSLKAIGRSKRGPQCAAEVTKRLGSSFTLKEFDLRHQSRKFHFFFCLLMIERHLPQQRREEMLKHFGRVLKRNHRHFKGLPQLFIKLYEQKKISENDSESFQQALERHKLHFTKGTPDYRKVEKCIGYLVMFRDQDDLFSSESDYSSTAYSMLDSSDVDEGQGHKQLPQRLPFSSKPIGQQNVDGSKDDGELFLPVGTFSQMVAPVENGVIPEIQIKDGASNVNCSPDIDDEGPHSSSSSWSIYSYQSSDAKYSTNQESTSTLRLWMKQHLRSKIFLLVIALIVTSVVGIPLCYKYAWFPLHHLPSSYGVQHREGNVPIIAQFNSFFVNHFFVEQEVASITDDSYHEVSLYLERSACNDLPTIARLYKYNETFSPPILMPLYMLEHSSISFHALASTPNQDSNPAYFYIVRSAENSIHFDPNCNDCRYRIRVGKKGSFKPTKVLKQISASDYYSFKIRVPEFVTVTYNLSVEIKEVDIDAINGTLLGTIDPDSDDQTIGNSLKLSSGQHCLFADIQYSSNITHDYTFLEVHIQSRSDASVGITVCLLLVLLVVIFLFEALLYLLYKKCTSKWRGLSTTNQYEAL